MFTNKSRVFLLRQLWISNSGAPTPQRAPRQAKTTITCGRCCHRCILFCKIKVRPRSYRSYPLWRPCNHYVKKSSNNLSNENLKTGVSREMILQNSSFWHFNSNFVLKTTETLVFMFSLLRLFD
jgi:hypothetical protein